MRKIILYSLFLPMLILANGIQENTESILRKEFGDDAKISFLKYQIPSEIKSNI